MTYESDIRDVLVEQTNHVTSQVEFDSIWKAVTTDVLAKGRFPTSKKVKVAAIATLTSLIPIAGVVYAATSFHWGGAMFQTDQNIEAPMSEFANPKVLSNLLNDSSTQTYPLETSRSLAQTPIFQPGTPLQGWIQTFGKGIVSPVSHFEQTNNGTQVYTGTTQSPLQYVDVYSNSRGQTVAVSQTYDNTMTRAWMKSKDITQKWNGNAYYLLGKDVTQLGNMDGGLAYAIQGSWSEMPALHKAGDFRNLVILHPNKNNTVSDIVLDESGGVSLQTLEKIADDYLNGNKS